MAHSQTGFPDLALASGEPTPAEGYILPLGQLVITAQVEALPGAPVDGSIYLLNEDNSVNVRDAGVWITFPAVEGYLAYSIASNTYLSFDGTDWAPFTIDGGDMNAEEVAAAYESVEGVNRFTDALRDKLDSIVLDSGGGVVAIDPIRTALDLDGGTTGQVLVKASGTNGDYDWIDFPEPEDELPVGGTAGDVLTKTADGAVWVAPETSPTYDDSSLQTAVADHDTRLDAEEAATVAHGARLDALEASPSGGSSLVTRLEISGNVSEFPLTETHFAGNVIIYADSTVDLQIVVPGDLTNDQPLTVIRRGPNTVTFVDGPLLNGLRSADGRTRIRAQYGSVSLIPGMETGEYVYLLGDLDTP